MFFESSPINDVERNSPTVGVDLHDLQSGDRIHQAFGTVPCNGPAFCDVFSVYVVDVLV